MMNRYKKLFSDTGILAIGTFGSKLLVFLLMPLYTALLTTEEYGTAEIITVTANLLIPLVCLGISNGIFRFVAEKGANREAVFSSSLVLLFFGLGGFLILSPLLLLIPFLQGTVWLVVAYVFFADLQAVLSQYIRAIDRTKLFAFQGILNTAVTVACNLLFLIVFKMGLVGYVLSVIVGNLVTSVFLVFYAKLFSVFRFSFVDRTLMKSLFRFSLPLVPTTVCWLITDLSDRYMVTYYCGEAVNGIYSAAYKIPTIVNLVSGIFMQAWQFSAIAESNDREACQNFFGKVFSGFLSVVMIGASGLILVSDLLCKLLLNIHYRGAIDFIPTLLCAAVFEATVSFFATVYLVKKKTIHSFVTAMIGAVLNIILNFLFIPEYGALGAAFATMASYFIVMIARLIDAPKLIAFRTYPARLALNSAILFAMTGVMLTEIRWKYLILALAFAMTVAINLKDLLKIAKELIGSRKKSEN